MRRGFINGMLIGSAAGLLMSTLFKNQMKPLKPSTTRQMIGETRKLGRRTGRIVTNMARNVHDFIQR